MANESEWAIDAAMAERAFTERWTELAREYADVRWCWLDSEEDINDRADMLNERPDAFIDRMAVKWDLNDPSDIWDRNVENARAQDVRDRIELFWQGF